MAEIRQVQGHEMNEAIQLADAVFRDAEQSSMAEAFPLVFSQSLGQSFGAFEQGKLVAFIGIVPTFMQVGLSRLPIYSLGAVCTHPDYRGKGYAGEILSAIQQFASKTPASLIFISGDRSLYIRSHCYHFGSVKRYVLNSNSAQAITDRQALSGYTVRQLESRDWFSLNEVFASRKIRYEQSISELASMIHAHAYASCVKLEHRVLVAEKDNRIQACVVVSVPNQFTYKRAPFTVETAGDAALVSALLAHAFDAYLLPLLDIVVPWQDSQFHHELEVVNHQDEKNSGTVYVVNPETLIEQLRPFLNEKNKASSQAFRIQNLDGGHCQITMNHSSFELEPQELVSLLFDVQPEYKAEPSIKDALKMLFPIPLPYVSGLNYV
ncbi:GNAT family N-acetyltransferase [Paenibacillus sp. GP183]|jgi:predicted N-acetyltransferase YhbS|uniref:GNAT family N-acetyltransferase n=1 Tax=Paenibacillus sp. GP183 TaxID=1882751 RepID=UPI00089B4B6B|nr:GNAT family N-acetyltransferase [Paenibacillus sp. GP183]SEC62002.1 Predicted N-acetyltransferase YhbS [Paenibacillus sp. GP183]